MASSKYDGMPILDAQGRLIHRMTPAERAKIFVPFDPLKGFQEALREKEREAAQIDQPWGCGDEACGGDGACGCGEACGCGDGEHSGFCE